MDQKSLVPLTNINSSFFLLVQSYHFGEVKMVGVHGNCRKDGWCPWKLPQRWLVSMETAVKMVGVHGNYRKDGWCPWKLP